LASYRKSTSLLAGLETQAAKIAHASYPPDEIAVRFHHRLVAIHPFPNGNGRHARLMADLLIDRLGQPRFSWGSRSMWAPAQRARRISLPCKSPMFATTPL